MPLQDEGDQYQADSPAATSSDAAEATSGPAESGHESVSADSQPAQGVSEGQSGSPTDEGSNQGADTEETLLDVMTRAAEQTTSEDDGSADGESASNEQTDTSDQGDEQQTDERQEGEGDGEQTDEDGKKLPPFHQHPRWQEMVRERNQHREQAESLKPKAQEYDKIQRFMDDNGLDVQEVARNLKLAALMKHDPIQARDQLAQQMEQLDTFAGYRLPEDLSREVEDGFISQERAQELARLRNQNQFTQRRAEETQQQAQQREQQLQQERQRTQAEGVLRDQVSAINSWEERIKAQDPDYSLLQPTVHRELRLMVRDTPPRSTEEATQLVQKAYDNAKAEARRFRPRKQEVRPGPSSSQSGANQGAGNQPASFMDAIRQAANG